MYRVIFSYWLLPVITFFICVTSFISIFASLFPLPYYLFKTLEVLLGLCVFLILWQCYKRNFKQAIIAVILSLFSLLGWYLHIIQ